MSQVLTLIDIKEISTSAFRLFTCAPVPAAYLRRIRDRTTLQGMSGLLLPPLR
jgi:hypothetical protein